MTETVAQADSEPPVRKKKLSPRTIALVVAAAILVLGGAGTGIYFLTRGDDAPAAGPSGQTDAGSTVSTPASGPTSGPAPAPPGGGGPAEAGNAKAVAEQAVKAINTNDPEAMRKISCDPDALGQDAVPEAKAELVSEPELTGDTGTVEVKLTIGEISQNTLLPLRKQNGAWCVD